MLYYSQKCCFGHFLDPFLGGVRIAKSAAGGCFGLPRIYRGVFLYECRIGLVQGNYREKFPIIPLWFWFWDWKSVNIRHPCSENGHFWNCIYRGLFLGSGLQKVLAADDQKLFFGIAVQTWPLWRWSRIYRDDNFFKTWGYPRIAEIEQNFNKFIENLLTFLML